MQLLRRLSFTMLLMSLMTLVACGDGDGDLLGAVTEEEDEALVATLTVSKSDGELSAANDIVVTAVVLDKDSAPIVNKTVTFSLAVAGSATLDPIAATATTDANGSASITAKVTNVEGSVNVTASYDDLSDNISFDSAGDGIEVVIGEPVAATLQLFTSSPQIPSSGADGIVLTAIAKDENNNLVEGVTITFASDSGALALYDNNEDGKTSNITGADGMVTMLLTTLTDPTNRTINAVASSADITAELAIEVIGTEINLTGSSSLAINDEATYIINLTDSDGNGIGDTEVAVTLTGEASNSVAAVTAPTTLTTDAQGQATLLVTGTSGGSNGIRISALNASAVQEVSVQSDSFVFSSFSNGSETVNPSTTPIVPDVPLGEEASFTLTWLREGVAVADGTEISMSTTRGVLSANTATTVDGKVSATLTATDAGKAIVTLEGSDIELTNQLEFEFFADQAATITAQSSPNSIGPNEQTSTISVVVKDANQNLVKNKSIKFVLEDVSGGSIFPAIAVTDSNGTASTVYTSNSTSAKDAVTVTAIVEDNPAIFTTANLSVSDRELFISLGTGNTLKQYNETSYEKEYSIFVTDADSNAVPNVELDISAIPESYYKGFWLRRYDGDEFLEWTVGGEGSSEAAQTFGPVAKCENEDGNFNGTLDDGEDFNTDGELTPGNIVSVSGSFVTDDDGHALVSILYPESYGAFLDVKLIVSGKVTGSEGSTQTIFTLPVASEDVSNEDINPPHQGLGLKGPFGVLFDCSKNIEDEG